MSPGSRAKLDPILRSVLANRFDAICAEMGETMLLTSRSPIFSEARDFATALFDARGRMVAEVPYIPVLSGALPPTLTAIREHFGDDVHPGDVILTNDPYWGGNNHKPDFTMARPVFLGGRLAFWTVAKGHHADVGGTGCCGYNPEATTIWEEGIRIPPVKLYEKGVRNASVWSLICKNVRMEFLVDGDLHCQVGASAVGERAVLRLVERYGLSTVEQAVDEILDASEAHMRRELARIPRGEYAAERFMDHDGFDRERLVRVRVTARVGEDGITFDFTGSDPQVKGSINSTAANTFSSSCLALFTTLDPEIRKNDGALRPVRVIAPPGTVVNCLEPAPCAACTICTTAAITEAIWLALSQAVPELVQAAWARWSAPATMGQNPRTGRPFGEIHFMAKGGAGATLGYDGWDHLGVVSCSGGLRAPDPELHEMTCPYTVLQYEYLPDSAGPGRWRGGLGTAYRWRVDADRVLSNNFGDGLRPETAPFGIAGGKGAKPSRLVVRRADGSLDDPDVHRYVTLNRGDVYEIFETGGGGYGDPFERPPAGVLEDVLDGVVSLQSAREDYGVVLDPETLELDQAATEAVRSGHGNGRPRPYIEPPEAE
ncbi:MAG: hydantoinase B/oxoprolinase family protein [Deltaproteobacteria bacterium]|nr:hydantoinase B/oxoprolinase family protein [Deltaproteobacteria bacterium]